MRKATQDVPREIREGVDITTITQLILRERESRDLQRWKTMRECFWPDSIVRVSWFRGSGPDFVTGSMDMAKRGIPAKHRLAPILVRLAADRALASLAAIIDLPVKLKGVEATLSTHSRFLYRAERRTGEWRIFGFDAIYMRDELTPVVSGRPIVIDSVEVKDLRPSYRMLSYYLKSQGFSVDSTLAGEDRPDLVGSLYQELFGWAKLPVPD
jgi:hypothetical protein